MVKNFPNLRKGTHIQIQEAEKTLKTIKGTYTETQYKLSKITNKDRILKAARKK